MYQIKENITNEIIIKNSRFITVLIKFSDESLLNNYLEEIKIKYPKATHYCYSYITSTHQKSSDDGEPGGTAGIPMLSVLEKEKLINVLAITIRYFGGIKLGAGGLVRAYSKSIREAILAATLEELVMGYKVVLTTSYNNQKELDYLLRDCNIINKEYLEDVTYTFNISKDNIDLIKNYDYSIISEEYIKKFN